MSRYLAARLATSAVLFLVITVLVFAAFVATPVSNRGLRQPIGNNPYRLHGSLPHQYGHYIWNLVRHGDLGRSYANREAVTTRLFRAAPVTISLVLGGLVVWLLIAIPLGALAALRPRSLLDRGATVFALIGISVHPVWLGLILGFVFGVHWHVFPAAGYCDLFTPSTACGGPAQWGYHLLLPWLVFALLNAALLSLMTRAVLREELDHDYVRTARAKGSGDARVVRVHVLRNVTLPLLTMIGMNIGIALGGVIFIESAFGLPGLGGLLRRSIMGHDVPMTAGIVLFMTLAIVLLNLLVDLAYAALDPRIKLKASTARAAT